MVLLCPTVVSEHVDVELQHCAPDGRMMQATMKWAGHNITIINTYWPHTHQDRESFLVDTLQPALAAVPKDHLMLVGDFNHVTNPALDRTPLENDGAPVNESRVQEQNFWLLLPVIPCQ
jgi:hypothetical protein